MMVIQDRPSGREVQVRVHTGNMIINSARIYDSNAEAVAQPIANELDAGAKRVWLVLLPDHRLQVIGDGHGMVPYIRPEDAQFLETYEQAIQEGRLPKGTDVRNHISQASLKSLEWMVTRIALSSKIPGKSRDVEGMRGIGAVAHLQYATNVRFITKPSPELYAEYLGRRVHNVDQVPVFTLIPPTLEQYRHEENILKGKIDEPPDGQSLFVGPWGNLLPHGTRVEVSGIDPNHDDSLKPGILANYLRGRFGERIRRLGVTLTIVDRVSAEGKRTQGGKEIIIQPIVYRGIPIIEEDLTTPSGQVFSVALYFNSDRGTAPSITRLGSEMDLRITDLEEFQGTADLWPYLRGRIDFPLYPNDQDLWNSSKTRIRQSKERTEWAQTVLQLVPRLREAVDTAKQNTQANELRKITDDLAGAVTSALREVDTFKEHTLPRKQPREEKKPITPATPSVLDTVDVRVYNEHNEGLPDVIVVLKEGTRFLETRHTQKGGFVSFGKRPLGKRYFVEMIVPNWARTDDPTTQPVLLDREKPGDLVKFYLITGTPAPERPERPERREVPANITYIFTDLNDPEKTYDQRLETANAISFNIKSPDLAKALAEGDEELKCALLANYTAAAFTEYLIQGDQHYRYLQLTRLNGRILEELRRKRQQRKREEAAVKATRTRQGHIRV